MCRCRHSFFGLTPEYKLYLHKQLFELAYFSKGGFNQEIAYNLPIHLRNFYYKCLIDVIEKENEANSDASNNDKNNIVHPPKVK